MHEYTPPNAPIGAPPVQPASFGSPQVAVQAAEHVTYAGIGARFVAGLLDMLIVGVPFWIVFGFNDTSALYLASSTIVAWLYSALQESSEAQATVGQRVLGMRVCTMEGRRISFWRATGRHFASYISVFILGIGLLMIAFTSKKQALHDMMAETLVVKPA